MDWEHSVGGGLAVVVVPQAEPHRPVLVLVEPHQQAEQVRHPQGVRVVQAGRERALVLDLGAIEDRPAELGLGEQVGRRPRPGGRVEPLDGPAGTEPDDQPLRPRVDELVAHPARERAAVFRSTSWSSRCFCERNRIQLPSSVLFVLLKSVVAFTAHRSCVTRPALVA